MPRIMRDFLQMIREVTGIRGALLIGAILLLAAPCVLAAAIVAIPLELLGKIYTWVSNTWQRVGQRMDDPVFGPVTYQGSSMWLAERQVPALGGRCSIEVPGSRKVGPDHSYDELLRGIIERQQEIRHQLQESIFREYQAYSKEMRPEPDAGNDWITEELRKSCPVLEESEQIWTLLSNGHISLGDEPGWFSIGLECTWDVQFSGVVRDFVDWEIDEEA